MLKRIAIIIAISNNKTYLGGVSGNNIYVGYTGDNDPLFRNDRQYCLTNTSTNMEFKFRKSENIIIKIQLINNIIMSAASLCWVGCAFLRRCSWSVGGAQYHY
jgi:hypothetical protein